MNNFIESASNNRPAVVLSCAGAPHGDLNLVRSLGAYGVGSIVVGEDPNPPARFSKYCIGYIHLRGFPSDPHRLHETLEALCQKWGVALPVLPSADPDLAALNELQQTPGRTWLSPLASPALVRALMDRPVGPQRWATGPVEFCSAHVG
jgi:predicted ATP-grasp superfamily ATP-dependent carboligase